MVIGLRLEFWSRVKVKVKAKAGVRVRVVFCSSNAQFLAILRIPHCSDAKWVWC